MTVSREDFEPVSECDEPLTIKQMMAIRNMAYYRACLLRAENKWPPKEEAAFLNGAMVAFLACRNNGDIPAFWIMGTKPLFEVLAMIKDAEKLQDWI